MRLEISQLLRAALAAPLASAVLAGAQAAPIAVVNPSFEEPVLAEGQWVDGAVVEVPGWSAAGNGCPQCWGPFNAGVGYPGFPDGLVPDGANAISVTIDPVFQVLTVTLQPNTTYVLTVDVGNPIDRPEAWGMSPLNVGIALATVGGGTVASFVVPFTELASSDGAFVAFSFGVRVGMNDPDIGKALRIDLIGPAVSGVGGPYAAFDNVRLEALPVPEAGTLPMLLLGLAAWPLQRRLRRGVRSS